MKHDVEALEFLLKKKTLISEVDMSQARSYAPRETSTSHVRTRVMKGSHLSRRFG